MGKVYGIGNPLIDIIVEVDDEDLNSLGIYKGAMHLIDEKQREKLLNFISPLNHLLFLGGSCPNTMITLASLGVEVTLGGKVGSDKYGKIYHQRLKELNVNDQLVDSSHPTGSSIILITEDSERTMNTYLGANRLYNRDDVVVKSLKASDYLYFTGYMWDTENQKEALKEALKIAKTANIKVAFDIADPLVVSRNRDEFLHLIEDYIDIVFANSEESRILFDNYDPYECCKSMGKLCETAIVKYGKHGSFISHNQQMMKIPVHGPQSALDTTGAGDTYAAGFLFGLVNNLSVESSGEIASYLAGEIIQQQGAQFSKEKAQQLLDYLRKTYQLKRGRFW
ncbi:MAG: adenosine kinase [Sphaerochaetaceae bacterium]|jgi:sugar/nucleoside kinase (ribokinase family)